MKGGGYCRYGWLWLLRLLVLVHDGGQLVAWLVMTVRSGNFEAGFYPSQDGFWMPYGYYDVNLLDVRFTALFWYIKRFHNSVW